jgi:hypothetical protein
MEAKALLSVITGVKHYDAAGSDTNCVLGNEAASTIGTIRMLLQS